MKLAGIIILLFSIASFAQKEQYNWYFGRYAAISFQNGNGEIRYDNPQNVYRKTASVSDPATGKLKLYTNGNSLWNGKHDLIKNGNIATATPANDVIIVAFPGSALKYVVFFIGTNSTLEYAIVDMSLNNGDGEMINGPNQISSDNLPQIAVIRHRYAEAYWVITHEKDNSVFRAYYLDSTGIHLQPVISDVGLAAGTYGDMYGSNGGTKLAVTHFYTNDFKAEVFDFDPVCGKISNPVELSKLTDWDHAYGIAFSPDDRKLYIGYGVAQSYLVQYSGINFSNRYLVAVSPQNYNIMRLGPDKRIYITTHDNGIPGERINVILNPNANGAACSFKETYLRLDEGSGKYRVAQFELPAFATGRKIANPIQDSVFRYSGTCAGDTIRFTISTSLLYDSIYWQFGDGNTSYKVNPQHKYNKGGKYTISLTVYKCGKGYVLSDSISIDYPPVINFPEDTLICNGTTLLLTGPVSDKYSWSTGDETQAITIAGKGIISLKASNGFCSATDSISIDYYPDIITSLGNEYFICEDDAELVKLDAGEGFVNYKWIPTNDTTQWIIVKNTGDYFVKVTDNFGCPGNDETRVKRRCGVLLFFPNAFTPNNDNLNDTYLPLGNDVVSFKLNIYNSWGQLVYTSDDYKKGWDGNVNGKAAADGVYIYEAEYCGYKNKRLQQFNAKGNVTLLR